MAEIRNLNELTLDREVSAREVQGLSGADAVAAFFARLGYGTDNRTIQTPGNLGITAEGTARPIKKIHQIADQEGHKSQRNHTLGDAL